ncbi:hypothetical protein BGZ57DRAFT_886679 [Hyaloscypha finlandica]|nr:hypothetical protein BGZ57DRAFT_886679 [Hyaloscypha finlandica]
MRLINTETMLLEERFGDKMPPYAILSHCWGEGEVSFQDLGRANWHLKHGSIKIKFTCQQAKRDGYGYAWVDTCCIDKSSSTELSEAINSMYVWYAEASICYVYLQDIVSSTSTEETFRQFEKSRWFTRGWTLQELLASQDVNFYNRNWSKIGSKNTLHKLLSKITQIPEIILQYRSHLKSVGVAQRMSWAANRQTTRSEDVAYCLLGLFDVNMPLLYGEGEKAFIRLQEEILKISDDQSLFAWVATKRSLNYGVLARSPAAFQVAGDIVPIPSKSDTHPYSMTNKGLSIQLPMLFRGSEVIGLLDCRPKGDLSSVIGIGLLRTSSPSIFERDSRATLEHCTLEEVAGAASHTIYIRGSQSLNAPWDFYMTFILRTIQDNSKEHDYTFSKAASILSEWERNTNMVRTAWNRDLRRCRLAFNLYDKNNGHTWLVMLIAHTKQDGTLRHFTTTSVFLRDNEAVERWNDEHFSEAEHFCLQCWCSRHDFGILIKLPEEVVLNQKVIMVDVQMPPEDSMPNATSQVSKADINTLNTKLPSVCSRALEILAEEIGFGIDELVDNIGFSDLGVDSLISLSLSGRIREELEIDVHSQDIDDYPTIGSFKTFLSKFETSKLIRTTIAEELGFDTCEIADTVDLATLGLDSLMNLTILGRLREKTGLSLPADLFITSPSIRDIEKTLCIRKLAKAVPPPLVSKPKGLKGIPLSLYYQERLATSMLIQGNLRKATKYLWFVPDGGGSAASYVDIPDLAGHVAVLGLNSPYIKVPEEYKCGVIGMATIFIKEMKRRQPTGPYLVAGWSAGGVIAFEIVNQLTKNDEVVEELILIDSPCPDIIEPLPASLYRWFASIDLLGSKIPPWLLPHFAASVNALSNYSAEKIDSRKSPYVTALWCEDGVCKLPTDPRPDPFPYGHAQFLLDNRTDFGPNFWDKYLDSNRFVTKHMPGNHFTMMKRPHVSLVFFSAHIFGPRILTYV